MINDHHDPRATDGAHRDVEDAEVDGAVAEVGLERAPRELLLQHRARRRQLVLKRRDHPHPHLALHTSHVSVFLLVCVVVFGVVIVDVVSVSVSVDIDDVAVVCARLDYCLCLGCTRAPRTPSHNTLSHKEKHGQHTHNARQTTTARAQHTQIHRNSAGPWTIRRR